MAFSSSADLPKMFCWDGFGGEGREGVLGGLGLGCELGLGEALLPWALNGAYGYRTMPTRSMWSRRLGSLIEWNDFTSNR